MNTIILFSYIQRQIYYLQTLNSKNKLTFFFLFLPSTAPKHTNVKISKARQTIYLLEVLLCQYMNAQT